MISYGGIPLCLESDALYRVEAVLRPENLYDFARRTWPGRLAAMGLPWLERETKPKLNRLVWPTGASRWAMGWFLTDDAGLAAIRPQAYVGNTLTSLPLVLSDGVQSIKTSLYMLPPRPLGQNGTGGDAYLITLVDQRYFWWRTAAAVAVTAGTTQWADLFAALASALGVTITADPVPAAYLSPPADFNTSYEMLPPQLDAAARSVGMRVVVGLDGSVKVVGAATAQTQMTANALLIGLLNGTAAGGYIDLMADKTSDLAGVLPASVTVAFPTVDANNAPTGATTTQQNTLAGLVSLGLVTQFNGAMTGPGTELLRSSCAAGPSNTAQVTALAQQMAADWYAWRQAMPDVAYAGAATWVMTGLEDRVEWTHAPEEISTRVQRPPWDVRDEGSLAYGSAGSISPPGLTDLLDDGSVIVPDVNVQVWDHKYFVLSSPGPGFASFSLQVPTTNVQPGDGDTVTNTFIIFNNRLYVWNRFLRKYIVLAPLVVSNVNAPLNILFPTAIIQGNNDLGAVSFARIYWDGKAFNWQGNLGYAPGHGFTGPAPNLEIVGDNATINVALGLDLSVNALQWVISVNQAALGVYGQHNQGNLIGPRRVLNFNDSDDITFSVADNPANGSIDIQANTKGFTGSQNFLTSATFDSVACSLTTTGKTVVVRRGLVTSIG